MNDESDSRPQWPMIFGFSVGGALALVAALFVALTLGALAMGGRPRCSAGVELIRAMEKALYVMTVGLVKPQTHVRAC